jgi:hypothetical protein
VWSRLASAVRERFLLAWLAGAAVWLGWFVSLALGGWAHDRAGHRVGADHVQYFVVGALVNEGTPELVYDGETMAHRQKAIGGEGWKGYLPFRYPPFYSLVFAPTSRLSYEASFLIWTAIALACLVVSGQFLGVEWRHWLLWSLCFYPVFAAVSFGQNSLVSLFLISATAALWLRDRPLLAGLVAGLLAFKPPLAVGIGLLWVCDIRRSWRALVGMAVTGTVLAAVAWVLVPEASRAYLESIRGGMPADPDRMALAPLYSSQAFWQLLLPGVEWLARLLSLATSVAGLIVFVFLWRRFAHRPAMAFGLAVLMTGWLSPYLMVYDWSILLVPAVLLGRDMPRDRWLALAALLWLAALLSGPLVRGQFWVMSQLHLIPLAVQVSMPALVAAVMGLGEER